MCREKNGLGVKLVQLIIYEIQYMYASLLTQYFSRVLKRVRDIDLRESIVPRTVLIQKSLYRRILKSIIYFMMNF